MYDFPLSFLVSRYPDYPGPFNVINNDNHKTVFPSLKDAAGAVSAENIWKLFS